jgi:hypothetical protein
MITKFKIFEKLNELPKVGDFVLLNIDEYEDSAKIWRELTTHIGEIVKIETEHGGMSDIYEIKFDDASDEIKERLLSRNNTVKIRIERFKYWSSDKNELEVKLNSEKYNL